MIPKQAEDDTNVAPAGSVKSSAHDMAQWLRFHLASGAIDGKRLVSEEALTETKMPHFALRFDKQAHETNPFMNVQSYAMGWIVQDYRGELMVSHSGAINSFRTQVALLPYRNIGVVVMENIGRGFAVASLRNAWENKVPLTFSTDADYYVPGKTRGEVAIEFIETWKAARIPNADILRAMTIGGLLSSKITFSW